MPAPVPEMVLSLADGELASLTWENEVGGLTYEVGAGDARRFVKWAPSDSGIDLTAHPQPGINVEVCPLVVDYPS